MVQLKKLSPVLLLLIVSLGSYLRCYGLENYYFWGDEAFHINLIPKLSEGIISSAQAHPHPPLFVFVLRCFIQILGVDKTIYFRSPSLIFGIMSIFTSYALAKRVSQSRTIGLFAAYLIATSPMLVEQSQLVRGYSLFTFLLLCLMYMISAVHLTIFSYWACITFTILTAATHYSFIILQPAFLVLGICKISTKSIFHLNKRRLMWIVIHLLCLVASIYLIKQFPAETDPHIKNFTKTAGSDFFLSLTKEILELWKNFFGTQTMGTPLITFIMFLGGFSILCIKKHYQWIGFILIAYLSAVSMTFLGKYTITSGRHSLFLLVPTLVPMIFAAKFIREKLPFGFLFLLLFIVFYQFRNPKTLFIPNNIRWSFGEGSYSFNDLMPLSKTIRTGQFYSRPIILDGGESEAVKVEQNFTPSWGVFDTKHQNYDFCEYMEVSDSKLFCQCVTKLASSKKKNEFFVLLSKSRGTKIFDKTQCFTISENTIISPGFSIASVNLKK